MNYSSMSAFVNEYDAVLAWL